MSRLLDGSMDEAIAGCPTVALREGAWRSGSRLPDCALLVVEEGLVLAESARPGASRRVVLSVLGPGAILTPPVGDERLEALADSWLTAVGHEALAELLRRPEAASAIVDALADALRDRQESLGHFASVRHVDRVRDKLLQLAREHGRVVPGGIRLDLPLTHELLGEMVGSARETVTWAIAQLVREGLVRREGRTYRLTVSPEALAS